MTKRPGAALAALVAFFLSLALGPGFIRWLRRRGVLERASETDAEQLAAHIEEHASHSSIRS